MGPHDVRSAPLDPGLRARARLLALAAALGTGAAGVACGTSNGDADEGMASTLPPRPGLGGEDEAPSSSGTTGTFDAGRVAETDADAGPAPRDGGADAGDGAPPFVWPTCAQRPATATARTPAQVWQANPAQPSETWLEGVYVSAISGGACVAGRACQLFVQGATSYPSIAAAAKQAIKVFASAPTATYFAAVKPGDRIDVLGHAWRYTIGGQNELLVQVNAQLPGCAKVQSTGHTLTPTPGARLADLTVDAYEQALGPVLLSAAGVSGRPAMADETFGLWTTASDAGFPDGGASIVSASPFFVAGGAWTGLVPGRIVDFARVDGVFGTFVPAAAPGGPVVKYLEIYARAQSDLVVR